MMQSIMPLSDIGSEVSEILPYKKGGPARVYATAVGSIALPGSTVQSLRLGQSDSTVRIYTNGSTSTVLEGLDPERITSACFAGASLLVTASTSSNICIWKLINQANEVHLQHVQVLRGHQGRVRQVQASRDWSIVVSASEVSQHPASRILSRPNKTDCRMPWPSSGISIDCERSIVSSIPVRWTASAL